MDVCIDETVLRTLEKEREARYPSAQEVMTELGVVSQSPAAHQPAPAPAPADDPGSARFSLSSAILSGLSFVVGAGTLCYASVERNYEDRQIGIVILTTLAAAIALVGFILGSKALEEIQKSRGEKDGPCNSVFAVVVWPLLLFGIMQASEARLWVVLIDGEKFGGSHDGASDFFRNTLTK